MNICKLTPHFIKQIERDYLLGIDTFIIPSPYVYDSSAKMDMEHSYACIEEKEVLGYILTYSSRDSKEYLIYKLVTSPYRRGRGIGTKFIEHLAENLDSESVLYLYIWQKQNDTLDFFRGKGFTFKQSIVYRNRVYHHLQVSAKSINLETKKKPQKNQVSDEIGRTRHDARKILSALNAMVNALAPENSGHIIEDINRETTTLVNMLNLYRDSMAIEHEVNLKNLLLERLIPYLETTSENLEITLNLKTNRPIVNGNWLNISRAMVNIASNAIDSMKNTDRPGRLEISLTDLPDNKIILKISDNGEGIEPKLMEKDPNGRPMFIGKSTKADGKGEGLGTVQVWNTFGTKMLTVESQRNIGTAWTICFLRSSPVFSKYHHSLQRRYNEFQELRESIIISGNTNKKGIITAIWRLRQEEIFLFELLAQFSTHHNIRDLYRIYLGFHNKKISDQQFEDQVLKWQGEQPDYNYWILSMARRIRKRDAQILPYINFPEAHAARLKSYGQYINKVIIFTLNPETGQFLASERKLAEHLDFAPYLGGEKKQLLRGEFVGDVKIFNNPLYLGVWSVDSDEDLQFKLELIQAGVRYLLSIGLGPAKRLSLYESTYVNHSKGINHDISSTFGEFVQLSPRELVEKFSRSTDDEMLGYMVALD